MLAGVAHLDDPVLVHRPAEEFPCKTLDRVIVLRRKDLERALEIVETAKDVITNDNVLGAQERFEDVGRLRHLVARVQEVFGEHGPDIGRRPFGYGVEVETIAFHEDGRQLGRQLIGKTHIAIRDGFAKVEEDDAARDGARIVAPRRHLVARERAGHLPAFAKGRAVLDVDGDIFSRNDGLELGLLDLEVALDLGRDKEQFIVELAQSELGLDVVG